jgi:hypothetical protein
MKRFALPVLLLLLIGASGFGVVQYSEGRKLRAELAGLGKDRDDLRKKLWELQRRSGARVPEVGPGMALPGPSTGGPGVVSGMAAEPPPAPGAPVERARAEGGRFNMMMNSPEVQHLMAMQQKAGLDGRYAALFKRLNLNPADLEKFKNLLVEKQSTVMDVMAAARGQGLGGRDGRDEIRQLVQEAQAEVDGSIRASMGEAVYSQYKQYEATLPQRGVVDQLAQRLSYSSAPLSDAQADQLVGILAATAEPSANPGGMRAQAAGFVTAFPGGGPVAAMMGGGAKITDTAIVQAQGVLQPQQVSALQSIQQEQQLQAKLMEQMRANRQNMQQPGANPAPATRGGG